MNNIINLFAPNVIAYFILFYIAKSKEFIFGYIVAVAAMDVFSFTKAGKQSLNRKLIGNTNSLARLSICLPVPRKPGLQPIIGVGDILYYTIITMFCIYSKNVTAGLYAAIIVLIGQLVNTVSTSILIRVQKEHYKGFPATLFPGLFIFIVGITGKVF
ncbi:MAG TPA: hypothetical protein VHQ24_16015 [Lachnospiraceae bacterium]|nr:hypothetical protein [Lachnospiraceae bacterium]